LAKIRVDPEGDYQPHRETTAAQLKRVRGMLGDDCFDVESEFSVRVTDEQPFVDVSVDGDGKVQHGDSYAGVMPTTGQRRNIGLSCSAAESAMPRDQLEEQLTRGR
jgi:hypothetical protein